MKLSVGGVSAKTDDTYYPPIVIEPPPPVVPAPSVVAAPVIETFETPGVDAIPAIPAEEPYVPPVDDVADTEPPVAVESAAVTDEVADASDATTKVAAADAASSSRELTNGDTGGAAAMIGYLGVLLAAGARGGGPARDGAGKEKGDRTMSAPNDGPGVAGRLFRGYGPLLGFAAMFLAIALIVPTQAKEVVTDPAAAAADAGSLELDGTSATVASETTVAGDGTAAAGGAAASGGTAGSAGRAGTAGTAGSKNSVARAGLGPGAPGSVAGCGDFQVRGDPYSPPCIDWKGTDNGGATSKGVTKDAIKVAVRIQAYENGVADALSKVAKATIPNESQAKIENTIRGITEYFNKYYEFYGRKFDLTIYKGKGQLEREILGGGPEGAQADALKVATEIGAFADVSAASPPYADALTRQKIVNIGAPVHLA